MPSASNELKKEWGNGEDYGEHKAEEYLKSNKYTLTSRWSWILPHSDYIPTLRETRAMMFLMEEHDYGYYCKDEAEAKRLGRF